MNGKIGLMTVLCVAMAVSTASAATYTYTPASGTGDIWSAGTNWSATPISGSTTALTFVGANTTVLANGLTNTNTDDISGLLKLNMLTLNGTGPASGAATININGTSPSTGLEFVSNGGTMPSISVNALKGAAGLRYNVNVPMTLTNNTTIGVYGGAAAATCNIAGAISGGGNLTQGGSVASSLILSGNNTYTGLTSVVNGSLIVASNNALGDTTGATTMNNVNGEVRLANGVTVTGETITVNGYGPSTAGGLATVANASATWAGTVILGTTDARLGTLTSGTLTIGGPIVDGGGTNVAINSNGTGAILFTGAANTYTGATNMLRGTLKIGANNALPTGTSLDVHQAVANANTTFDLNGYNQTVAVLKRTLANGTTTVTNSSATLGTLTVGSDTTASSYDGVITGRLGLTKVGSSTLTLGGVNTYTGPTAVDAGTLKLTNASAIANSVFSGGAGSLVFDNSVATHTFNCSGLSGSGDLVLTDNASNAVTLSINNVSGSTTYSGTLGGTGGITMNGSTNSSLTLSGNNTYSGATSLLKGSLIAASNTALGSTAGAITMTANNGEVRLADGVTVTDKTVTVAGYGPQGYGGLATTAGASATWAGTVRLSGTTARVGTQGGTLTISGPIVDDTSNNNLVVNAGGTPPDYVPGTVLISGTSNTYTGATNMLRGILKIGANNALPTGTTLDVHQAVANSETTFDLNGYNQTVAALKRTLANGKTMVTNSSATIGTLTVGSDTTASDYSGTIAGNLALTKVGSTATILSGVNTYSDGTTVQAGTLTISGNNAPQTVKTSVTGGTLRIGAEVSLGAAPGSAVADQLILDGGTLDLSAGISGVTTTSLGSGYTAVPKASLTGGAGNIGAVAVSAAVSSINVTNGGSGYATAPTVIFDRPQLVGGVQATGTAVLTDGVVTGVTITNAGSGYTAFTGVSFSGGGGTGAVGTISGVDILGVALTSVGTDYTVAPTGITIDNTGAGGSGLAATVDGIRSAALGANRGVTLGAGGGTILVGAGYTPSIAGAITGSGALTKTGAGKLTLTGATTYAGNTTVNAGTLQFGDGTTNGATLASAIVNNAAVVFNIGASTPMSAGDIISGDGTLAKSGAGTLTLNGVNTYTGATTVQAGTMELGVNACNPVLTLAGGADIQGGRMVFDYTGTDDNPAATIQSLLITSYSHGWTNAGDRIRNTTAGTTGLTLGWKDDGASQVTIMATYAGDANLDGTVDGADLDVWKANVGSTDATFAMADLNYDGAVDGSDLDLWKVTVGYSVALSLDGMSMGSAVPEPGTLALLLPVAAWFGYVVARRRRREV